MLWRGGRTSTEQVKVKAMIALGAFAQPPENARVMVAFPGLMPVLVTTLGRADGEKMKTLVLNILLLFAFTCVEAVFWTPGLLSVMVETADRAPSKTLRGQAMIFLEKVGFGLPAVQPMFKTPGLVSVVVKAVATGTGEDVKSAALGVLALLCSNENIRESLIFVHGVVPVLIETADKAAAGLTRGRAIAILSYLADREASCHLMFNTPGLALVLTRAVDNSSGLKEVALLTLKNLAKTGSLAPAMYYAPQLVPVLVKALDKGPAIAVRKHALFVLSKLASHSDAIGEALLRDHPGLLEIVVRAVESLGASLTGGYEAVAVLCELAASTANAVKMLRTPRLVRVVLEVAAHGIDTATRDLALLTLRNMAVAPRNREPMSTNNALLEVILDALRGAVDELKASALEILWALSESRPANGNLLQVPGLIDAVVECCASENEQILLRCMALLRGLGSASDASWAPLDKANVIDELISALGRVGHDPLLVSVGLYTMHALASIVGPTQDAFYMDFLDFEYTVLAFMVEMVQAAISGDTCAVDGTISLTVSLTPLRAACVVPSNRRVLAGLNALDVVNAAMRLVHDAGTPLAEQHGEAAVVEELCMGIRSKMLATEEDR